VTAIDGFLSTWSNARQTYGQGTPQTGDQYDNSGKLNNLQSTVQTAAPTGTWTGAAAEAYAKTNNQHGEVLGQLAALDKQLASQVNNSAQVVATGRQNLDSLRQWVVDAANSVPPGKNAEQIKMQIAQRGLAQLQDVIKQSNAQSNEIGQNVSKIGDQYQALKEKLFKQGTGDKDDPQLAGGEEMGPVPPEQQAKEDVEKTLKTGDKEAAARVDKALSSIQPGHPLDTRQAAYLNEMQKQQHDMSVADLKAAEDRLDPSQKHIIGDSWQLMSNDDVPREANHWDDKRESKGGFDRLPTSVQDGIKGFTAVPVPGDDSLKDITSIVKDGQPQFQQGTEIDRELMRRADRIMDTPLFNGTGINPDKVPGLDGAVTDIFDSAGRDHQIVYDQISGNHGDDGQDFLHDVSTHEWDDNGKSAGSLFGWTGDEHQADPMLAAETAQVYADYLGTHSEELLAINGHTQIGDMNPELVKAYSHGLMPYQEELVTDQPKADTPFHRLDDLGSTMDKTKGLFAVIDSQHDAAVQWNKTAYQNALDMQQSFADYAHAHPDLGTDDNRADDLQSSARLLGAIDGGINEETLSNIRNGQMNADQAYEQAKSAYEFKKDLLRNVFSYGPGGDLVTNSIADQFAGPEPNKSNFKFDSNGTLTDVGLSTQQQSVQHQITQANYTIASEFIHRGESPAMPDRFFNADGSLKAPSQIDPADWSMYDTRLTAAMARYPEISATMSKFSGTFSLIGGYHA
jgi:uncharacterized protein YukE